MRNLFKKHAMALAALAIAATSVTLMSFEESENKRLLSPVTIYFTGDVTDPDEVANASFWSENNPDPTENCQGSTQACSMEVEDTDLQGPSGNRTLDPLQITLDAVGSESTGYRPVKDGGNSSTNPIIHNKN